MVGGAGLDPTAALMALSPLFWYYALVAEVRALNDLLALSAALFAVEWSRGGKPRSLLVFSLVAIYWRKKLQKADCNYTAYRQDYILFGLMSFIAVVSAFYAGSIDSAPASAQRITVMGATSHVSGRFKLTHLGSLQTDPPLAAMV